MLATIITDEEIDRFLEELDRDGENRNLILDEARRKAISGYDDIQACPGSGKTTLVGLKLLCLAKKWTEPRRGICVLTHTNVAKDEILHRVRRHPAGHNLLSYPHFIGTIQEFVNTFLALPTLRSMNLSVARIDDAYCATRLNRMIAPKTRSFLQKNHKSVSNLRLICIDGALKCDVPGLAHNSKSDSYRDMVATRKALIKEGCFFYSEMYAIGNYLIASNPRILEVLRYRFPVVMVDEMQDAQKFQDDLISLIFGSGQCNLQRFGDPDQSIFDGLGGEEPNTSYNGINLEAITQSHRFCPDIALHAKGLSQRRLNITTSRDTSQRGPHNTIILYDDDTRGLVLDRFADIVAELEPERRGCVKAVGGVAVNDDSATAPLNIGSYWSSFDKTQSVRGFSPASLCQAVRYCASLQSGEVSSRYSTLVNAIVEAARRAGIRTTTRRARKLPISLSTLPAYLRFKGVEREFRHLLSSFMMMPMPTESEWQAKMTQLTELLSIDHTAPSVESFLKFDETILHILPDAQSGGNIFCAQNGVSIHVATIHSVKGETHDATLVLETKYRNLFDVREMLPFIIDPIRAAPVFDPAHPRTNESVRAGFMKKLYVASTRPRHLLCLAAGRERVTLEQIAKLREQRWDVLELSR